MEGEAACQRRGEAVCQSRGAISQGTDKAIVKGRRTVIHWKRKGISCSLREGGWGHLSREGKQNHSLREDASNLLREGGCCSLWEARGHYLLLWEGWTMNFYLGKFKTQQCWSFKFNGLEQIATHDLKLFTQHSRWAYWKKMNHFKNSCHRHVYKIYDNVDTNLQLNLPPIWCQGKAGMKITDVWHMSDWPLTLYDFSWLCFLLRVTSKELWCNSVTSGESLIKQIGVMLVFFYVCILPLGFLY